MKRKIAGIFLLLFWLFQSSFVIVFYQIKRLECRRANSGFQPNKNIQEFVFKKNKVNWVKQNKEFEFNGHLFDVVSITECGSNLNIKCYPDKKEDKLVAEYKRLLRTGPKQESPESICKMMVNCKYLCNQTILIKQFAHFEKFKDNSGISYFENIVLDIVPRPPEC